MSNMPTPATTVPQSMTGLLPKRSMMRPRKGETKMPPRVAAVLAPTSCWSDQPSSSLIGGKKREMVDWPKPLAKKSAV
jgi:hypothetical protein